jgi:hypothetical protein
MSKLDDVLKLINMGKGDLGRLEHIKKTLENGKNLYTSDKEYLEKLVEEISENTAEKKSSTIDEKPQLDEKPDTLETSEFRNDTNFCTNCGNEIVSGNNFCPKCGNSIGNNNSNLANNISQTKFQRGPEWKSLSTTTIFAVILGLLGIQGVGHFYLGKIARGLGILFGPLIVLLIGIGIISGIATTIQFGYYDDASIVVGAYVFGIGTFVFYIVMFFWQIKDARKLCNHYNDYLEKHGEKPW